MSRRNRFYTATLVCVLVFAAYARTVGRGLDDLAYFGIAASMLVVLCPVALIWSELAPDGDLGRPPAAPPPA